MINRTRRFLSSARWLSAINVIQAVLLLAVSIVLARSILPEVFGRFAYLLAVVEGLSLVTGFGVNTSILQNTAHPPREFQNTGFALAVLLILGYTVIAAVVGALLVPGLIFLYLLLVFGKAFFMLAGVHGILLQKDYRFRNFSLIQFGAFVASSAVAIALAVQGHGMRALVMQYVVLQVLVALFTVWWSPFRISPADFFHADCARTLLRNGRQLFVSQMVEKLLAAGDKIWINHSLGAPMLAFYNRAVGLIQRFQSIFLTVMQPLLNVSFAELQADRERSSVVFNTSAWVLVRASLIMTLIFLVAPREFILLLYGENWLFAASLVPLIALFVFLSPLRGLARNFLLSNGCFAAVRNIQLLELALFIAALWAGSAMHGIEGLCIGVSLWMAAGLAVYLARVSRVVRLELRRVFLLPTVLLIGFTALNHVVRQQPAVSRLGALPLVLAGSTIVVAGCAAAFLLFEREQVLSLWRRLRS
jgi:O-antigen/teichoic acid export membrane protein